MPKKKKPAKGTAAYYMSDEYKKKVLKGRKPGAAKKAAVKYKVKQSVSKVKSKVKRKIAGRKAMKSLKGKNVGIGVSGETKKTHAKAVKKTQRKRRISAGLKKAKSAVVELSQRGRRKKIGASKETKVRKGAAGLQKTKGGEYVKYKKDSKAAGSFRSAFKSGCAGGKKSFTWDGRSYSCKKK